ncbi:MAG: hypothetical protein KDI27_07580 [Gammaproteobacteria bacterium]|nr:hypothetical protein [Gammaproteobacteria bacterium]MCP5417208.1 hypothetical protein [Chromatiaceae bacterium]
METEIAGSCWQCGAELGRFDYGRENNCLGCGKPTRVCRNCRWYDPARSHQCQEPIAEPVLDKTRPNYCEFFEATFRNGTAQPDTAGALRRAAEDLFK